MLSKMILILLAKLACQASVAHAEVIDFDHYPTGPLPKPWISGVTGGGTSKWSVEKEAKSPSGDQILKQSAEGIFPWAVKKDISLENGFVQVKFKAISGKEDQAGGVIWRFKDSDNYYIARANSLEDNVTIYHTKDGKRRSFKGMDIKVAPKEWHTLRVEFNGKSFRVIFDGKDFTAEDDTISGAGAVGLWTKSDSVTLFDDFEFGGYPK